MRCRGIGTILVAGDEPAILELLLELRRDEGHTTLAARDGAAERQTRGIDRMDQIRWAVLERSGAISIMPKQAEG